MSELTNPFPQMGTYGPNRVDVVGYDEKLNSLINTITGNTGSQPLFFRIIGEFGQGKTTLLRMIESKLSRYSNIKTVWWDIAQESDFKKVVKARYKELDEKQKLVFLIDESQEFVERTKNKLQLSQEEMMFLKTIRDFSDGRIENVDSSKIAIVLALHPESDIRMFGPGKGRLDLAERGREVLELSDLDYYMAMAIADKYFTANNMRIANFFDESVIYATYAIQSYVDEELIGKNRKNGRTFVQILFKMFELISQKKYNKIGRHELIEILTSRPPLITISMEVEGKTKEVPLVLPGISKYAEITQQFDHATKDRFDYFLFNPRWHFKHELETKFPTEIKEAKYLNRREAIVIQERNYREFLSNLETHEQNIIESFPKERIFLNNEPTYLVFCEGISTALKKKIDSIIKIEPVYRISDEYLIQIYKWSPSVKSEYSELLAKYSISSTQQKRELIFDKTRYKTYQCSKGQMRHYYQITTFEPLKDVRFEVAFFYYPVGYPSKLKIFIKDIIGELNDLSVDYAVLLIDPYVNLSAEGITRIETEEFIEIRKLQNRLFIFNFKSTDEFGQFLFTPTKFLEKLFHESAIPFLNEAEEKGLSERFLGIQSKIHQSQENLINAICTDIKNSMDIESIYLWMNVKQPIDSELIKEDAFTIKDIGKKTYEKYVRLDDNLKIIGAVISPMERTIFSLLPNQKTSLFEIEKNLKKYVASYSRINVIKLAIQALGVRGLISIDENEKIQKNNPSKLLTNMKNKLEKIRKTECFLTTKQKDKLEVIKRKIRIIEEELQEHINNNASLIQKAIYCYILKEDLKTVEEMIPETKHYAEIAANIRYIERTIEDLTISFNKKILYTKDSQRRDTVSSKDIMLNDLVKNIWNNEKLEIPYQLKGVTEFKEHLPEIIFSLVINSTTDETQKQRLLQNKERFIEILKICKSNQDILLPKEVTKLIIELTTYAKERMHQCELEIQDSIEQLAMYIENVPKRTHFSYINSMVEKLKRKRKDLILDKLIHLQFNRENSESIIRHCARLFQHHITLLKKYVELLISTTMKIDISEEISRVANQIKTNLNLEDIGNISDEDLIISYINTLFELSDAEYQELELFLIIKAENGKIPKDKLRNIAQHYNISEETIVQSLLKKGKIKEYRQITRWFENNEEIKKERISYEIHDTTIDINFKITGISNIQKDISVDTESETYDYNFIPFSDDMKGQVLLAPLRHPEIIYGWEEINYKGKRVYRIGKKRSTNTTRETEEDKIWFRDSFGNKVSLVPDIPSNIEIRPELIKEGLVTIPSRTDRYTDFISLCLEEEFRELLKSFLFNDNKIVDEYELIARKYEVNDELMSEFVQYLRNNKDKILEEHKHMYEFVNIIR